MKYNAIARIVIYSVLALILTAALLTGILVDRYMAGPGSQDSGTVSENGGSVDAAGVARLEINWACGSITIRRGETGQILFTETGPENNPYPMVYELSGSTLELSYAQSKVGFGFGNFSMPSKDLVITVPADWFCEDLEINGASLDILLQDLSIGRLSLDGASCDLKFSGILDSVQTDGASNNIFLACGSRLSQIDMDGASCDLDLWLPEDCGFRLQMDGLSCDFTCGMDYGRYADEYVYGDQYCRINIDGVSCDVSIRPLHELGQQTTPFAA